MYAVGWDPSMQSTYYYRGMNLIGYTSAEKTAYYRMNAHGNVVAVVDGFGETLKTYKYDAFGGLEEDGNEWLKILFGVYVEDSNPFRYCAEYYDKETEFIYLRAIYYSPEIQRFISEDPIKDGINWYAYCGNNPVNAVDSLGYAYTEEDQECYKSLVWQGKKDEAEDFKKQIETATNDYLKAEEELNYVLMNESHKTVADLRNKYYQDGYEDTYDYTHGGKYDLYTNGCSNYEEGSHLETVFYFDQQDFENFYLSACNDYVYNNNDIIPESVQDMLSIGGFVLGLAKSIPALNLISGVKMTVEKMANYIKDEENESVVDFKKFSEQVTALKSSELGFYVYLLDGGSSTEVLIKIVDTTTNKVIDSKKVDLHQYKPYNSLMSAANEYGQKVAVNYRNWQYTYFTEGACKLCGGFH